jgi:hypothetical protein
VAANIPDHMRRYTQDQGGSAALRRSGALLRRFRLGHLERMSGHVTVRKAGAFDASCIADLMTQLGYPATTEDITDRLSYWVA